MNAKRYAVTIEPTRAGRSAYSPDVPGLSRMETPKRKRARAQEALDTHFEPIPDFQSPVDYAGNPVRLASPGTRRAIVTSVMTGTGGRIRTSS